MLVVGDVMSDVLVTPAGALVPGSDTAATITYAPGGSAANTAAWLAALGVPVTLAARIGDDIAGARVVDALADAGVSVRGASDPGAATGTCVVLLGGDGERTMLPDRGANDALAPEDLPAELFRAGAHLHLTGYTLLGEGSRAAGREALARAVRSGMTVSVTPSSAAPLLALGAETLVRWTAGADLLLANAAEAGALSGEPEPRRAANALAEHYREVVVTCGAAGAVWADGLVVASAPAAAVAVVDTTGAGDAFAAGFLAAWLAGQAPESALAAGNRLAGTAVARRGAWPPHPPPSPPR